MIAVVADLRRQIEGNAQAVDALRQQVAIAAIRLRRRAEARILPHRPQAAAIHRWLDAAREGKFAWERKVALRIERGEVPRAHERLHHGDCSGTWGRDFSPALGCVNSFLLLSLLPRRCGASAGNGDRSPSCRTAFSGPAPWRPARLSTRCQTLPSAAVHG